MTLKRIDGACEAMRSPPIVIVQQRMCRKQHIIPVTTHRGRLYKIGMVDLVSSKVLTHLGFCVGLGFLGFFDGPSDGGYVVGISVA